MLPELLLLSSPAWTDYELLDSGNGQKLERFGAYTFIRPEHQALWKPALPQNRWDAAHAVFHPSGEETGGQWERRKPLQPGWTLRYKKLKFQAQLSASRHLGVFPEQAAHWDWIAERIRAANRPLRVLNLFGYTGLATLAAAQAGAEVTHVDASKKSIVWAQENQRLSGLEDRPIRWMVDDALKFVQREDRRGSRYDGLLLDPPKFGRGPKGEVWEAFEMFPALFAACRAILTPKPLFVVVTAYAIRASALSLHGALSETMAGRNGEVTAGELVNIERSQGRAISLAIFARWRSVTSDQ